MANRMWFLYIVKSHYVSYLPYLNASLGHCSFLLMLSFCFVINTQSLLKQAATWSFIACLPGPARICTYSDECQRFRRWLILEIIVLRSNGSLEASQAGVSNIAKSCRRKTKWYSEAFTSSQGWKNTRVLVFQPVMIRYAVSSGWRSGSGVTYADRKRFALPCGK